MGFWENLSEFMGKPVQDWPTSPPKPEEFERVAFRLRVDYDDEDPITSKLEELLEADGSDRLESLVIGAWHGDDTDADPAALVESLVAARGRLKSLRHIFFGDIIAEENEISWIHLTDLAPLLNAYPLLEHLTVRGSTDLTFGILSHSKLRQLILQSGGLPVSTIHEVSAAKLPALEHLELWLGDPGYGGDATVEDLSPFLSGELFPKLRYLGLKNSMIQDEIAGVVAVAPVIAHLETLDLSTGTLGDEGARSLLNAPAIRKLKHLDLKHHFISTELQAKLIALGIDVDLTDPQEPHEWGGEKHRFNSVGE